MTTMLKMALEHVGFAVVVFNDPVLALKRFRPNTYGLVILDVMMRKMDALNYTISLEKKILASKFVF